MKEKKVIAVVFLAACAVGQAGNVYGAEMENITIKRELSEEELPSLMAPPSGYRDENGKEYSLSRWEVQEHTGERNSKWMERTIVYRGVEGAEALPDTIPMTEEISGSTAEGELQAEETNILAEEWTDDFVVPLTFHAYGAGEYQLGGVVIGGEEPLEEVLSHDAELLYLLDLPEDAYRINDFLWDGEPYEDENGQVCRNAVAIGEKLMRDYEVVYQGDISWQEPDTYELVMEYKPEEGEIFLLPTEEETEAALAEEAEEAPNPLWYWVRSGFVVAVAAGLFGILLGLLLLVLFWLIQRRNRKNGRYLPRIGEPQ